MISQHMMECSFPLFRAISNLKNILIIQMLLNGIILYNGLHISQNENHFYIFGKNPQLQITS